MLIQIAYKYFGRVNNVLEAFTKSRYWELKTVLLCLVLFLVTSVPEEGYKFDAWEANKNIFWKYLEDKIEHPFTVSPYQTNQIDSNLAKRAFRLTMPLLGHIFGLKVVDLFIIQQLTGILFLFVLVRLLNKSIGDKVVAFLMTLAFICTYIGKACFTDIIYGWFDGMAYFFLALAMLYRNYLLIGLCTFLACWVDERALLASSLVFLWWKFQESEDGIPDFRQLLTFSKFSGAVPTVWVIYICIRWLLSAEYELATPIGSGSQVGWHSFKYNVLKFLAASVFSPIEFFWLFFVIAVRLLFARSRVLLALIFTSLIVLMVGVSLCVGDVTRSLCYVFPAILIALHVIKNTEKMAVLRSLALIVTIFNFMVGSYFVMGTITSIAPSFKGFWVLKDFLLMVVTRSL